MKILGIESSCDETAASIIQGNNQDIKVLSNIVSSQIEIHKKYGGVVPEIAAREHVLNILPVIDNALTDANISKKNMSKEIDAIAVTIGPGLVTSLLTGIETAKTISYVKNIPIIGINHIEGHIYANFIENTDIKFPAVIMTVSGGHTMLVLMKNHLEYELLGETRDDAAGEAFDKSAKLLELSYPGGPIISKYANTFKQSGKKSDLNLPRPMIHDKNFEFSFSGLKTAVLYKVRNDKNWKNRIPEYCYEIQQAIIDVLVFKTIKASKKFSVKTVMLAGGVSANTELRTQLETAVKKEISSAKFIKPKMKYTTDNAAMIASAGYFHALKNDFHMWQNIKVDCNSEIG